MIDKEKEDKYISTQAGTCHEDWQSEYLQKQP